MGVYFALIGIPIVEVLLGKYLRERSLSDNTPKNKIITIVYKILLCLFSFVFSVKYKY